MKNLPSILATCPDYDIVTRYLSAWASVVLAEASAKGYNVYSLRLKNANRSKLEGMLTKNKPDILFINGHGNAHQVAGQNNEVILDAASANLIQNTVIYAVSCQSAKVLGQLVVKEGAKGYIGYIEDFILASQPHKVSKPTSDKTAALFLDPSNHIIRSVIKGHSVEEAAEKGRKEFSKSIRRALNSDIQSDDDKYVPYLLWNKQWLVCRS